MTKTTESALFLFSPPMQACYSLSSAPTSSKLQSNEMSELVTSTSTFSHIKLILSTNYMIKNLKTNDQKFENSFSKIIFEYQCRKTHRH